MIRTQATANKKRKTKVEVKAANAKEVAKAKETKSNIKWPTINTVKNTIKEDLSEIDKPLSNSERKTEDNSNLNLEKAKKSPQKVLPRFEAVTYLYFSLGLFQFEWKLLLVETKC